MGNKVQRWGGRGRTTLTVVDPERLGSRDKTPVMDAILSGWSLVQDPAVRRRQSDIVRWVAFLIGLLAVLVPCIVVAVVDSPPPAGAWLAFSWAAIMLGLGLQQVAEKVQKLIWGKPYKGNSRLKRARKAVVLEVPVRSDKSGLGWRVWSVWRDLAGVKDLVRDSDWRKLRQLAYEAQAHAALAVDAEQDGRESEATALRARAARQVEALEEVRVRLKRVARPQLEAASLPLVGLDPLAPQAIPAEPDVVPAAIGKAGEYAVYGEAAPSDTPVCRRCGREGPRGLQPDPAVPGAYICRHRAECIERAAR